MTATAAPLLAGEHPHTADAGGGSTAPPLPPALLKLWNFVTYKSPSFGARVAESLDYEPVQNDLYFGRLRNRRGGTRHVYGYSGLTFAKNLVMIMTGTFTGLVGVILSKSVKTLIEYRNDVMETMIERSDSVLQAFAFNMAYGVTLVMAAACMVTFWAPTAAGAGVTLVMAYLNGTHIPNLLRFRTLIAKVIGAALAVPSGLTIGPEGPMVHIGACIASTITYANCAAVTWLRYVWPWPCNGLEEGDDDDSETGEGQSDAPVWKGVWCQTWEELHEDSEHREFISAGASAGLSAAFGAPIGGVLFAMEEASSFWSRKVAWRCFIAAICAAFVMSFSDVSNTGSGAGRGIIVFSNVHVLKNLDWIRQFPFMVIVAALGGFLGAAFNFLRRVLWKVRASRSRKVLRVMEALVTIVYCVIIQFVAATYWGSCQPVPDVWPEDFNGIKWGCKAGQHNDLATAFWSTPDDLLSRLFSVGHENTRELAIDETGFTQYSLVLYSVIYLSMLALCAGVCVPAGMFMPAVMLGAASGLAAGVQLQRLLPGYHIQPGLYALICATAALAGVFRSAISLVVLVVEGTRGINFLFGVIIAVLVANFVGSALGQDGVYESEIERDGNVFYLHFEPPRKLSTLTAEEVMVKNPRCLPTIVSVRDVLTVLRDTTHHGFPVVQQMGSLEEGVGQLEGLVLRSQLLVLLREKMYCDLQGHFLNPEHAQKRFQYKVERAMRLFYRLRYTHHRYMATHDSAIVDLNRAISHADSRRVLDQSVAAGAATTVSGGSGSVFDAPMTQFDEHELLEEEDDRAQVAVEEFRESVGQIDNPDNLYLNLRPFMNSAPLTVQTEMSAARAHRTFVTLGMRHLCVVNNSNRVVGIITRKDLEHAAAHGGHDHPAQNLTVSRSLIASTSRVYWRHAEEHGGHHRRVSSAAVRLPDTLPILEESSHDGMNGHGDSGQGKKEGVEHVAHVSPVSGSPLNTQQAMADTNGADSEESRARQRNQRH